MMSSVFSVRNSPAVHSSFWSAPSEASLPRKPSSKVCDTTCLSGGSAVRKLSMKHGYSGSAQASSAAVGARLASA